MPICELFSYQCLHNEVTILKMYTYWGILGGIGSIGDEKDDGCFKTGVLKWRQNGCRQETVERDLKGQPEKIENPNFARFMLFNSAIKYFNQQGMENIGFRNWLPSVARLL